MRDLKDQIRKYFETVAPAVHANTSPTKRWWMLRPLTAALAGAAVVGLPILVVWSLFGRSAEPRETIPPATTIATETSSAPTITSVDATAPSTTTPSISTTSPPTTVLATPGDLPRLAIEPADGSWGEAQFLGDYDALGIVGRLPGSRSLLLVERRGQVEEGCEGGIEPLGRLVLENIDTGSSSTLLPELELTDSRFALGPNGMLALVGGCDANAWLAGVGRIDSEGSLTFRRLGADPTDRITASNNAGVSVTWTTDGSVLFIDSTRVDAETGESLDPANATAVLHVHAQLADGTRLVSSSSGDSGRPFWIIDSDVSLEAIPEADPDFVAQAIYPAVQVIIDGPGERGYATFEDWEASTIETVAFGVGGLVAFDGRAKPSPSGTRLLIENRDQSSGAPSAWTIVDLRTNTSKSVTLPVELKKWSTVQWGATDDELLITAESNSGTATSVWLMTLGES